MGRLLLAFLVLLGMLLGTVPDPVLAQQEKTVVVAVDWRTQYLDPAQSRSEGDGRIRWSLFDQLVGYEPGGFKIVPMLAESWDISEDGKTYTFYLRKGVRFHDGEPFNAEAVKLNIDRQIDPNHPYHNPGSMTWRTVRLGDVASVEVVDEYTVRFHLHRPSATLLDNLTSAASSMMSPAVIRQYGRSEEIGYRPVGTGPFMLEEWRPGSDRVVLRANPDYWGGKPGIDRLIFATYQEPQTRVAALQSGAVDMVYSLPPDFADVLRRDRNIEVIQFPTSHVWFIHMDVRTPPFDKLEVRQALNYAIDKDAIVAVLHGGAIPANGPLAPIFNEAVQGMGYEYNPEKAKELLRQAGYPNGFEITLAIPEGGPGQQDPRSMATVIQANLAAIGVRMNIETYEWGTYEAERIAGRFPFASRGWYAVLGNPDDTLFQNLHSSLHPPHGRNTSFYSDPQVDAWLEEARIETDYEKRREIYMKIQEKVIHDAPWIFVTHEHAFMAHRAHLTNFHPHPTNFHRFDTIRFR